MKQSILLMFSLLMGSVFATNSAIEDFKKDLYFAQRRLTKNREAYYAFIDPYIKKAQSTLKLVQYAASSDDASWTAAYYNALLNYNIRCFNASMDKRCLTFFVRAEKELRDLIFKTVKEFKLSDVNAEDEFNKTKELFEEANKAYYNYLGLAKRVLLKRVNFF